MSDPTRDERSARTLDLLHAYHDGELSRFARWSLERRLRRSPELQRELAALSRIGDWVRASQPDAPDADLWERIALRLPALDVRRAEAGAARPGFGWLAWPGALASAAIAAVLAFQWLTPVTVPTPTARKIGVVRWLDSGPRDVMVLQPEPDTTIVWVIGAPGARLPRGDNGPV
jgi:anti-sigma factor RsiW